MAGTGLDEIAEKIDYLGEFILQNNKV